MQNQRVRLGPLPSIVKSRATDKLEGVSILDNRVTLQKRIHMKQGSAVYQAFDKQLMRNVAVKVYQRNMMDQHDYKMYKYEVEVMKKVKSPHIIEFIEELDISTNSKIYLVMEYCEGITLHKYYDVDVYQKPELETLTYLIQILQGLYALHMKNYVHRDLKLENIMIYEGRIKIIDYGFSKKVFDSDKKLLCKTHLGTLNYQAPEILLGEKYNPFRSDIFSLGVMIYMMQQKQFPYEIDSEFGLTENEIFLQQAQLIKTTKPKYPHYITNELKQLINQMLEFDPAKRITLSQLLRHELLTNLLNMSNQRPQGALYVDSKETLDQYAQFYEQAQIETIYQRYRDLIQTVSLIDIKLTDEEEQSLSREQRERVLKDSQIRRTRDTVLKKLVGFYEQNLNIIIWLSKIFYNYQRSEKFFNLTQHQVMALLFQLIVLEFKSHVQSLKNDQNVFLVEQDFWAELLEHDEYKRHKMQVIEIYSPIIEAHELLLIQEMKDDENIEQATLKLMSSTNKEEVSTALTKRTLELIDQLNQYTSKPSRDSSVISLIANNMMFYLTLINPKNFFANLSKRGPFDFIKLEEEFKPKSEKVDEWLQRISSQYESIIGQNLKTVQAEETDAE